MRYRVFAELKTPAAISVRRATGNDLDTLRMIPGTVLRGALAEAYLEESGRKLGGSFKQLFLQQKVRFGDLRIADARPWPLSARECSAHGHEHKVLDLLLRAAAGLELPLECREAPFGAGGPCGAKLAPPRGFYRFKRKDGERSPRYQEEQIRPRRVAHCEIDPELLSARTGRFHSAQVLERGDTFEGLFGATDEGARAIESFIGAGRTVFVGRGRSRGQGRVLLRIQEEPSDGAEAEAQRIADLNEAASQKFRFFRDKIVFTCSMDSPTILLDRWLFSRALLRATDLAPELERYDMTMSFHRRVDVAGWHAAGKLPKAEVAAIAPGSCFLLAREAAQVNRSAEYAQLARLFVQLDQFGVGERCEEGFGEVRFCRQFHWRLAEGE